MDLQTGRPLQAGAVIERTVKEVESFEKDKLENVNAESLSQSLEIKPLTPVENKETKESLEIGKENVETKSDAFLLFEKFQRMRFEKQDIFNIKRRLITWNKNNLKKQTPQHTHKPLEADTREVDRLRKMEDEFNMAMKLNNN